MAVRSRRSFTVVCLCFVACLEAGACDATDRAETREASPRDAGGTDADASDATSVPLREVLLIDHTSWNTYPDEEDPLPQHQPEAPIDCERLLGWLVERDAVEVDTAQCNYALIAHPALVDVPAGSEVELELWHFDLIAPEPAEAHIALFFDADLQWETHVQIPGLANLERLRFRTTRALRAGEPLRWHLHNHGQNTWMLGEVFAYVPE